MAARSSRGGKKPWVAMTLSKTMRFKSDQIELITRQGGQEHKRQLPYPRTADGSDWLTPAAAQRLIEQKVVSEAARIEFWTLDAAGPTLQKIQMTRRGQENIEVVGKIIPAVAWDTTMSILPGMVSREYTDPLGRSVKASIALMPQMTLTIIEADRQLALRKVDPPRLMAQTLVRPDKPIDQPPPGWISPVSTDHHPGLEPRLSRSPG